MKQPPRFASWLLRRTLPRGVAGETILGDLVEEWRRRGTTPRASLKFSVDALSVAARYVGRRGPVEQANERIPGMFLDNLLQDLRFGWRSYAKSPGFAFVILSTLALGIGASTAIFSMVNGILLRPLPLPQADRLAYANETNPKGDRMSVAWPNYLDWHERARSFEHLALSRGEPTTLTGRDRAQRLSGRRVTADFFQVIGTAAAMGRTFAAADDRADATPAIVISDDFWRAQLGSDPAAIGSTLRLDDQPHTIIGILPRGFQYLRPTDIFLAMGPMSTSPPLVNRGNHNGFSAVGLLKPGVTFDAANAELKAIAASLEREHPDTNSGVSVRLEPLSSVLVEDVRPTLLALFAAVGFLLIIACVNVANLLIARGAGRQHELAVRAALGGGRARLTGQLLVESTMISVLGGAIGVAVAALLLRGFVAYAPEGTPRIADVRLDPAALLFAATAAMVCGIVFGALPALQASGIRGQHALVRSRATGIGARSHRLRRTLIVIETALALVLLTGAGLMMRTVQELTRVDAGFRVDHLLTTRFTLAGDSWTVPRRLTFFSELLTKTRALPGVANAALTLSLPIDGSNWNSIFIVGDKPVPERSKLPGAAFTPVSDGYFETMGVRLVRGRFFDGTEKPDSPRVVIVNETLAHRLWPGEEAIGKRLKQGWPETPDHPTKPDGFFSPWREVIGVVADVKLNGVTAETPLQAYLPLVHEPTRSLAIVTRSFIDPASVKSALEGVVHDLNKDLPLVATRTMDQVLDTSTARERMSMLVFAVFAIVALALAAFGLYGIVAHGVTERTHEIGVRMALGADSSRVLGLVARQGLSMAAIGTTLGVAGAVALSRWMQTLLFGVQATEVQTLGAVVFALLAVAGIACYIPAARATRVDPSTALRAE